MKVFMALVHILDNAPFYQDTWSRKERAALFLLETVFRSRYAMYLSLVRLNSKVKSLERENRHYSKKLDDVLRAYAQVAPGESSRCTRQLPLP